MNSLTRPELLKLLRGGILAETGAEAEKTKARIEAALVAAVAEHTADNWQAATWLLERAFPERWARLTQRKLATDADAPPQVADDDPFAEVVALAGRRKHA